MPEIGKEEKTRGFRRKRNLWGGQNLIWGIGAVDAKMQGGYARSWVKKNSMREG